MSNIRLESDIPNIKASCYTNLSLQATIRTVTDLKPYKTQSSCKICKIPVKNSHFSKSKKCYCKFCYCAVCINCSNLKCFHSILNKAKRICIDCFNEAVIKKVKESTKDLVSKYIKVAIEESKVNIGEINSYEDLIEELKEKVIRKKEELARVTKEFAELSKRKDIEKIDEAKITKNLKDTLSVKLRKVKIFDDAIRKHETELSRYKKIVMENEIRGSELARERENIVGGREKQVKTKEVTKIKCIESLKDQIVLITGMANTLRRDNENLKEELKNRTGHGGCSVQ